MMAQFTRDSSITWAKDTGSECSLQQMGRYIWESGIRTFITRKECTFSLMDNDMMAKLKMDESMASGRCFMFQAISIRENGKMMISRVREK